jgi:hypothetical protein
MEPEMSDPTNETTPTPTLNHSTNHSSSSSSNSSSNSSLNSASNNYWKLCTGVLGVGFLIAVASHAGPSRASANDSSMNQLTITQAQAKQSLKIGGFDSFEGVPVFVILNEQGQRIGTLPMDVSQPAN